ncbi:hypothetical protein [Antarcticirhabdus aurantiaca]|uniref:Uncharacterized protein n=1 Tax=Antarcticirhabdus aurantiaca TaxID=2606717 RepID=A0ACD4NM71_9HYPH|nr:hypothetical protein [Antarcticirhabdus aurantiaca]WAJ27990.1 hypothetical protein OXU80_24690 [Jeongeuplla avenae]
MSRTGTLVAAAALLLAAVRPAAAVLGTCTIVVGAPGVLTPNAGLTTLSTQNSGGSPATATITTLAGGVIPSLVCALNLPLNCFRLSLTQPTDFMAAPAAARTASTFSGGWRVAGGSSSLNVLSAVILNGTYTMHFDLTATKASGVFAAGTYQAQQTIRCE